MSDLVTIEWNAPTERDEVLAFIARMGFTPRDAVTWDALAMRAIVARRGSELIGVLPIELRPVRIGGDQLVTVAHQTCVAVAPGERGTGIGSRMQTRLDELLPTDVPLMSVFREDPASAAYAWYRRAGFEPAMHMVSWQREVGGAPRSSVARDWLDSASNPITAAEIWQRVRGNGGFFVDQTRRPLMPWLEVHPYRSRYTFELLTLGMRGYAVVGIGTLHSHSPRLDVMDLVADDDVVARELMRLALDRAALRGVATMRLALVESDPLAHVVKSVDMVRGWAFDLLVKRREQHWEIHPARWRYATIDFI